METDSLFLDPTTRALFEGDAANIDPGLGEARQCCRIIEKIKKEAAPDGNDTKGYSGLSDKL
jgi:hypothetical protein